MVSFSQVVFGGHLPLTVSQRLHIPLNLLQLLGAAPAFLGVLHYASVVQDNIPNKEKADLLDSKLSAINHWLAVLWCVVVVALLLRISGRMMRLWLKHINVAGTITRMLALYAGLWGMMWLVYVHYGRYEPVWCWFTVTLILMGVLVAEAIYTSLPYQYKPVTTASIPESSEGDNKTAATVRNIWPVLFIVGGAALFSTILLLRQESAHYESMAPSSVFRVNTNATVKGMSPNARVKILMVVFSSWTESGLRKRQVFRETTLKLAPDHSGTASFFSSRDVSLAHRFIVGKVPNEHARRVIRPKVQMESDKHNDILFVDSSDLREDLSQKLYKTLAWADQYEFDYMIKINDDYFARLDVVSRELQDIHPAPWYWRGLVYRDIPPLKNSVVTAGAEEYPLLKFPPYVGGGMYILSRDIVHRLVSDGPRFFTNDEEQNLGLWILPFNIEPVHDRRIQQVDVCEDDMIGKHFSDHFEPGPGMYEIYDNVVNGQPLCKGFKSLYCAVCYSCDGRWNHYHDWNFDCDPTHGITLRNPSIEPETEASLSRPAIEEDMPRLNATADDPGWIVPGLLHRNSSVLSDTDDWSLLHWAVWTSAPDTFKERHYRTLELVFTHTPRAVVIMLSPTLPSDFFAEFTKNGYRVHVVHLTPEMVLDNEWYLGPNTEYWVKRIERWRSGKLFIVHLADYIRLVMLYRYGGMYMDMDALWIRAPPDPQMEFIGTDFSSMPGDSEWTLDAGLNYLATGVMRFRRGWRFIHDTAEGVFNRDYDPSCYNCGGPKAITMHVRRHRKYLIMNGLHMLQREVLYPYTYLNAHKLLQRDPLAAEALDGIVAQAWSIHLFGRMTNAKAIEPGSVVDLVFKRFSLEIPRRSRTGHAISQPVALAIVGPAHYRPTGRPGMGSPFNGLNLVLLRGGASKLADMELAVEARRGGRISFGSTGIPLERVVVSNKRSTKADINALLATLVYYPASQEGHVESTSKGRAGTTSDDEIHIRCKFADSEATHTIRVSYE